MACSPWVLVCKSIEACVRNEVIGWNQIIEQPETPEFGISDGVITLVDSDRYVISGSIPVNSDCGLECSVNLQIGNTLIAIRTSTGGSRILQFVHEYNKENNDTEEVRFTFHAADEGSYTQGGTLRIEKDYYE